MTWLFRFLLSVCIFLPGGYFNVFAAKDTAYTLTRGISVTQRIVPYETAGNLKIDQSRFSIIINADGEDSDNREPAEDEDDDDDEEDEVTSCLKNCGYSYCFIADDYPGFRDVHINVFNQGASHSKHFAYSAANRYILYRVIRI